MLVGVGDGNGAISRRKLIAPPPVEGLVLVAAARDQGRHAVEEICICAWTWFVEAQSARGTESAEEILLLCFSLDDGIYGGVTCLVRVGVSPRDFEYLCLPCILQHLVLCLPFFCS